MKTYAITLLLCGGTFVLGYALASARNRPAPPVAAAPLEDSAPAENHASVHPQEPPVSKVTAATPTPAPAAAPAAPETPAPAAVAPATPPRSAAMVQAINTLVSPDVSLKDKQAVWKQLRESGQLDQAIDALKQGAAENPNSAQWQAELGQGELQKAGVLSKNGASVNEMGIMGMQADQSFDAALKIDPSNWEAQFFKAVAMAHWPAELNKGGEVVQMLSHLIDQQETQTPQPQFAQTYTLLGEQYSRMGQLDYAQKTWQLGLQKFPGDPTLLKKAAGQ